MIIFISGTINAGKSTISELISARIENTAHIEVDLLRRFIKNIPLEIAAPISRENTISVASNLIKRKFNVIIDYLLSKNEAKEMIDQLKDLDNEIYFFTLSPSLENVLTTRGGDLQELDEDQKDRIRYHYSIGINNPGIGIVINSTKQTPEETADEIASHIKEKHILDITNI